jgi:hypothetical protein
MSEAAKNALLNSSDLPGAMTFRTGLGICPPFATDPMTGRTELDTLNFNFFATAECRFLEGKSEVTSQALALLRGTLGSLPKNGAKAVPEGFENIPQPAKAKVREAFLYVGSAIAVVSLPFFRVGENLVGLVYFLEPFFGTWLFIAVRMVLLG